MTDGSSATEARAAVDSAQATSRSAGVASAGQPGSRQAGLCVSSRAIACSGSPARSRVLARASSSASGSRPSAPRNSRTIGAFTRRTSMDMGACLSVAPKRGKPPAGSR
jgi:hypothetical protein